MTDGELVEEDIGGQRGPFTGPVLSSHLASPRKPPSMIGPTLPPHLTRQAGDVVEEEGEGDAASVPSKRVLGPTLPPGEGERESEPKLSSGAQAFLDREKRMKEAAERKASGQEVNAEATNNRPEWMLAPPTSKSFSESIQKDQSAALKNRGFSQAQNTRVQKGKGGSGLGGTGEDDHSLWTETPQERAKRLMEEELGIRPKGELVAIESEETRLRRRADELREEQLQKAIAEHAATRGPSLLEQHQAKRRAEVKGKDKRVRDDRGRRKGKDGESSSDQDRHTRKHRRHENRSESSRRRHRDRSASDSSSDLERRSRKEKKHGRSDDRLIEDKEEQDDRHHRHRRSHRTASEEREREKRKELKEKEREKRRKRKKREQEEKEEKKGAPMMVWDRDSAMSVAGKLMDSQKRMDTIRSASSLGSRFGGGSSRYL
ncbi:hypothetical protein CBS101457_003563 [Exobasidium rhododendri]|nr:hypothetical protein CBS101457_003563 [Exobasidium rhododendri]